MQGNREEGKGKDCKEREKPAKLLKGRKEKGNGSALNFYHSYSLIFTHYLLFIFLYIYRAAIIHTKTKITDSYRGSTS